MLGLAYNYLGQDIVDRLPGVKDMANTLQKLAAKLRAHRGDITICK